MSSRIGPWRMDRRAAELRALKARVGQLSRSRTVVRNSDAYTEVVAAVANAQATAEQAAAGEPVQPTVSPVPEVIGGIGVLFVRWPPLNNPSPVNIEVHISATSPVAGDVTTLAATVNGTQVSLRSVPDGTPDGALLDYTEPVLDANGQPVVDADGKPVTRPKEYHVALRAKDTLDRAAPLSPEASGSMVQITGPDIAVNQAWVGTMNVNQLTGGTLNASVVVGGDVYAEGAAGERVSLSGSGFSVTGPTALGKPIYVSFPTDGAKPNIFSGTVEANTLDVTSGATLRSAGNSVAAESTLRLSSGVAAPQSPPATEITWPEIKIDTVARSGTLGTFALDPSVCEGLACELDLSGTVPVYYTIQNMPYSSGYRIWRISASGVTTAFRDVGSWSAHGIAYADGYLYVLERNPNPPSSETEWWFYNVTSGGYSRYYDTNTSQYPTLGTDFTDTTGANIMVAETVPTGSEVQWKIFNPANLTGGGTATALETTTSSGIGIDDTLAGVALGSFDYGAERTVVVPRGSNRVFRTTTRAGAYQSNEWWGSNMNIRGFAWNSAPAANGGQRFVGISNGGTLRTYTGLKWTTESGKWWVANSWRDTDTTTSRTATVTTSTSTAITTAAATFTAADVGSVITAATSIPANTTIVSVQSSTSATLSQAATTSESVSATIYSAAHETPIGPKVTFDMKKRAQLTVTTTALPPGTGHDKPNAVGIYIGRGPADANGDLARTEMWRQPGTGTTLTTAAPTFTGDNPPASNNFPGTAPGKIASTFGDFWVDGNGDGSPGTAGFMTAIRRLSAPPGKIDAWMGTAAPPGALICDGLTEYNQADYPELFNHLSALGFPGGTAGSTSTKFKTPDLRDRYLTGVGALRAALGANDGLAYGTDGARHDRIRRLHAHGHTLSVADHNHPISMSLDHAHGVPSTTLNRTGMTTGGTLAVTQATHTHTPTGDSGSHDHGGTGNRAPAVNGSVSQSSALPAPSMGVTYIIWT